MRCCIDTSKGKHMTPILTRNHNGGIQEIYRFDNGYGASKIKTQYSYGGDQGLWEIAVIKFHGDGTFDFNLCYDTHITGDVIGRLTDDEAQAVLQQIEELA
jgi:hypothetical protein